jgi:transcriptional antiterminator RfaH
MSYWAVVQVESQCEHVVRLLLMRARYETYMPRIRARSRIAPLFPGYLFVRIVDRWYPVIWTVGVVRLLMSGDQPARLPEKAMTEIRKREIGGFVKLPSPTNRLRKGQPVRVIRGSFEGQVAIHQGMSSKERVWVLLNLLGQKVPVELPSRDLEPLPIAVR